MHTGRNVALVLAQHLRAATKELCTHVVPLRGAAAFNTAIASIEAVASQLEREDLGPLVCPDTVPDAEAVSVLLPRLRAALAEWQSKPLTADARTLLDLMTATADLIEECEAARATIASLRAELEASFSKEEMDARGAEVLALRAELAHVRAVATGEANAPRAELAKARETAFRQCVAALQDIKDSPDFEGDYENGWSDGLTDAIRAVTFAVGVIERARPTESQPLAPFSASTPDIIHGGRFVAGETPTIDMVPGWPDVPVARALKMEGEMK